MRKLVLIAASIALAPSAGAYTCDFYREALEPVYRCGPKGYPLAYGKKYCERIRNIPDLSPDGQTWREVTGTCLQTALIPVLSKPLESCAKLSEYAYGTHSDCYVHNGVISICDLPSSDVAKIMDSIDRDTLWSPKSIQLIFELIRECRR